MFWPCVMLLLLFRSGRNFVCRRFHYDVTLSIHQPNHFSVFLFFKWTRQRGKKEVHVCMCTPAVSAAADDYFQSYIYILYTVLFLSRGVNSFFVRNCVTCLSPIYFSDHYIWWSALSLSFSVELFRPCFHFFSFSSSSNACLFFL